MDVAHPPTIIAAIAVKASAVLAFFELFMFVAMKFSEVPKPRCK